MWLLTRLLSIWHFCLTLEATILRLPCTKYADFKVSHHNKILKGSVINSETGINDVQCMVKCIELPKCQSYNIKVDPGICQLNSKSERGNSTRLSDAPGWLYKSTDFTDKLVGYTCRQLRPCRHDLKCLDTCSPPFFQCVDCGGTNDEMLCEKEIENNSCNEHTCKNGNCVKTLAGMECICNPGFTGRYCETDIDECYSLPCLNGGTCMNLVGRFNCTCLAGYKGLNCEKALKGCYGLKARHPSLASGFYEIDGSAAGIGNLIVYCDMETDGGGWTQVLNVSSTTNDFNAFIADKLHYITDLRGFRADKKYGMKNNVLMTLRSIIGYTQFRFKCKKRTGSKLLHIKTKDDINGYRVVDCLTKSNSTYIFNLPSCDTFKRLPDDRSQLAQQCQKWNWNNGNRGYNFLMNHLMYIPYSAHWNIGFSGKRYECDSFEYSIISNGDFWEIYVR